MMSKQDVPAWTEPYVPGKYICASLSAMERIGTCSDIRFKRIGQKWNKKMEKQYEALTDEELIEKLRAGEAGVMDFLLEKYKYLVRKKANTVFLLGGDTDDLIQEGMIGLFKAIRDFDSTQSSFYYFADLCIGRQIYHAIEAANRKKHVPLNSYVSLSEEPSDYNTVPLAESLSLQEDNPEQILIERENVTQFLAEIQTSLSPLEQKVLNDYLDGMNYRQIAEKWNKPEKSIDNALQRIKAKVQKLRHDRL